MSFEEALAEMETIAYWDDPLRIAGRLRETAKTVAGGKEEELRYEIEAFSLHVEPPLTGGGSNRFTSFITGRTGISWPDFGSFTGSQFAYYDRRLSNCQNPFFAARYADILYESSNEILTVNRFEVGKRLVGLLREVAAAHLSHQESLPESYSGEMERAVQVSISLGLRNELSSLVTDMIPLLEDGRYLLALSTIMRSIRRSPLSDCLALTQAEACLAALERAATDLHRDGDHTQESWYWEELVKWARLLKVNPDGYITNLGLALELRAAVPGLTGFQRAAFLEEAMQHYINHGLRSETERVKPLIKSAYEQGELGMNAYPVEPTLPQESVRAVLDPYVTLSFGAAVRRLVRDPNFVISAQAVTEAVADLKKRHPLGFMVRNVVVDNGKKVAEGTDDEASLLIVIDRYYMNSLMVRLTELLHPLFTELVQRGLGASEILGTLVEWSLFDAENEAFVSAGLERFFAGDYISALHVLIPRFENSVRTMFAKAGYATTSVKGRMTQQEETFNEFLSREDVKTALGQDAHKLIEFTMVSQTGLNLRNSVAHGLIGENLCNAAVCVLVIYELLLLTKYTAVSDDRPSPNISR